MPLRLDHPDHSSDVGFGYPGLTSSSDEPPVSGARNGYAPIRDGGRAAVRPRMRWGCQRTRRACQRNAVEAPAADFDEFLPKVQEVLDTGEWAEA